MPMPLVSSDIRPESTGKSHLWDRPNAKPWVTDPVLMSTYDAIVALKVDRLTRADDDGVAQMEKWLGTTARCC